MDYSIRIVDADTVVFSGYFTVLATSSETKLITAFYDYSLPVNGGYENVLLAPNDFIFFTADNLYVNNGSFTGEGVNIYSTSLQSRYVSQTNHFNLYSEEGSFIYYIPSSAPFETRNSVEVTFEIRPILPPPRPFWMGSLFSNNAQVYYKPHSFSSGSGGVTNSRAKKRRT